MGLLDLLWAFAAAPCKPTPSNHVQIGTDVPHRCFHLKNTFSPSETHAFLGHTHTCIQPWLRCSATTTRALYTENWQVPPGRHDASSKGHGLWLLLRLLFPSSAFSQYLRWLPQSCAFSGLGRDAPFHGKEVGTTNPWAAAPCLPWMSQLV